MNDFNTWVRLGTKYGETMQRLVACKPDTRKSELFTVLFH